MKQHFFKLLAILTAAVLTGCGGIHALIKEGDPDQIYAKALEFYGKEKWNRASTLFESVAPVYMGTSREDSIAFYNAHCKYKNTDYDTASQLLDEFRRRFGRSAFIEDAEGMYADCFYRLEQRQGERIQQRHQERQKMGRPMGRPGERHEGMGRPPRNR